MTPPIKAMQSLLQTRQSFEDDIPGIMLSSHYDKDKIENPNTYLHPGDLYLLTLAIKAALGVPLVCDRERMENKTLYISDNFKDAYQAPTSVEIQALLTNKDNQPIIKALKEAVKSLSSQNKRISMMISSSSLDNKAQGRAHFFNVNFERLNHNHIRLDIEDSFGPSLAIASPDAVKAYEQRLRGLLNAALDKEITQITLTPLALGQESANCGIHALVNKINFEHDLTLNPKACVAPLREAIAWVYGHLNEPLLAEGLINKMKALGIKPRASKPVKAIPKALSTLPPSEPNPEIPRPVDEKPIFKSQDPTPDVLIPQVPKPPTLVSQPEIKRVPRVETPPPLVTLRSESSLWARIKQAWIAFKTFWINLFNKIMPKNKVSNPSLASKDSKLPSATIPIKNRASIASPSHKNVVSPSSVSKESLKKNKV